MDRPVNAYDPVPTYVHDPVRIAAHERTGRRLRDEHAAGLLRGAWRWLFRRAPAKRPRPEVAAHPARA